MLGEGYHYHVPMAEYLADPCPEPSLSTQTVKTLFERTAMHARAEHVRFGGKEDETDVSRAMDEGAAAHALALGGAPVEFVGEVTKKTGKDAGVPFIAENWQTDAAKEAAAAIRARGGIPLLEKQRGPVEAVANEIKRRIVTLGEGDAEVTGIAKINGVWIRTRADWLATDKRKDAEVKTCDNADAATFVNRCIYPNGYDIQAELRLMVHKAITGDEPEFVWLPVERPHPHASGQWITPSDDMREMARKKIIRAIDIWKRCLDSGVFPGYGEAVVWAFPPTWAAFDVEARV